jgi:hypothetical protein
MTSPRPYDQRARLRVAWPSASAACGSIRRTVGTLDEDESTPWPSPEDTLFERDADVWYAVAYVGWGVEVYPYAEGYWRAANLLAEHVIETGRDRDFLVYPILFLYRHYIELQLKDIAVNAAALSDHEPPPSKLMNQHELKPVWIYFRDVFFGVEVPLGKDIESVERILNELSWADSGSIAFRYAHDKKGERSLPANLEAIDLKHIYEVMAGLGNLLGALGTDISVKLDAKAEMIQDHLGDLPDSY